MTDKDFEIGELVYVYTGVSEWSLAIVIDNSSENYEEWVVGVNDWPGKFCIQPVRTMIRKHRRDTEWYEKDHKRLHEMWEKHKSSDIRSV